MAQALCYGTIYAVHHDLEEIGIQLTYCNIETEEIRRFKEVKTREELEDWFKGLIHEYVKWGQVSVPSQDAQTGVLKDSAISLCVSGRPEGTGCLCVPLCGRGEKPLYPGAYRSGKDAFYRISQLKGHGRRLWGKAGFISLPEPLRAAWQRRPLIS